MDFVHLHNHTDYSFLDGATKVKDLTRKAKELGMPAVALTDHGNLCGAVEFYREAQKNEIKPIIGAELYLTEGSRFDKGPDVYGKRRPRFHLLALAKNQIGYKNLIKLSSAGYLEGFYHKPRIDLEYLEQHREGLIVTTGCLQGIIPQAFLKRSEKEAIELAGWFNELFGDDFYFELQDHGIDEQHQVNRFIIDLAKKMNKKLIATNDVHYLEKGHADPHDILLCVQTRSDRNDTNRFKFHGDEFYLKTPEEMAAIFKDYPEALTNTVEIAEKCDVHFNFKDKHFPYYPLPPEAKEKTHAEYLYELCEAGLPKRYGDKVTPEIRQRLETEMGIIKQKQLADYFLIVRDFIIHAKNQGIPVGPGRGSAAGSLVSYLIEITNIDPIRYELLFERFINPERESYPDIDVDFADTRRAEVIEYVKQKYGQENVCQIMTFGRMLSKGVVRDVGRVMQIPLPEVDAIAKLIPEGPKVTLKSALEDSQELSDLINSRGEYKELMKSALVLEGTIRNAGVHAAGVVITPEPLNELVPLFKPPNGDVTTQFDMKHVEMIGLLKVDFLGLKTLSILEKAVNLIKRKGIDLELEDIPIEDKETYELFGRGDTIGIFQFESGGMRESLKKLKPERLEDLTAMNALYRPGPMENIDTFIRRKHGKEKITYLHQMLASILDETYGIIVYQEQVMQIANKLSNMSLGRADVLRRAMGKKKQALMDEMKPEFVEGCGQNGINAKTASEIWDLIEKFAKYGFNKSHAAGYALVAYQTGFLKTHYPAEFMAASMSTRKDNTEEVVLFLEECKRMGVDVLPPDVNESEEDFSVTEDGAVRFGMAAIKNVGGPAIQAIMGERETRQRFQDLYELAECAVCSPLINRRVLENLILAGACDSLNGHRQQQLAALDQALAYAHQLKQEKAQGQFSMFGEECDDGVALPRPEMPDVEEMPAHERLAEEKARLGFYFSGHPLFKYRREIESFGTIDVANLSNGHPDQEVRLVGILVSVERRQTKKGDVMGRGKFEDLSGVVGVVIFPKTFDSIKDRLVKDVPVLMTGKLQKRDDNCEIIVDDVQTLEDAMEKLTRMIRVSIDEEIAGKDYLQLENIIRENPGPARLQIWFHREDGTCFRTVSGRYSLAPRFDSIAELRDVIGEEAVTIMAMG